MTTSTPFRDLLHAANLRHVTEGFTSTPKEGALRIFSPLKIRRLRPGLNPRTKGQHATPRPPTPLHLSNTDLNELYLVKISGFWCSSSLLYNLCSSSYIKNNGHWSETLQQTCAKGGYCYVQQHPHCPSDKQAVEQIKTKRKRRKILFTYASVSQTFFKWGPLSLVRMFYGPPYSWDYQTH